MPVAYDIEYEPCILAPDNATRTAMVKAFLEEVEAAGAFGLAFGWLGWLILAWAGCIVLDWISGSAAAAAKGHWSSAVARAGIWHKGGMIVVVLVAAVADCVLGLAMQHLPALGIDYTVPVLPVILVWYIFTELGSIAENATDMGAPVPAWLTKSWPPASSRPSSNSTGPTPPFFLPP